MAAVAKKLLFTTSPNLRLGIHNTGKNEHVTAGHNTGIAGKETALICIIYFRNSFVEMINILKHSSS